MAYAILLISPGRWLQAKTQQPIGVVSLVIIIHVNDSDVEHHRPLTRNSTDLFIYLLKPQCSSPHAGMPITTIRRRLLNKTRNSAVADKPRDALVQYAMGWLTPKHVHMYYHADFGRSTSKCVNINREEPQNWARWALPLGMCGLADPFLPWVATRNWTMEWSGG